MLTCTLGAIALAFSNKEIPDIVVAIGSAAIEALAGLFAPSATSNQWVRLTAVPLNSLMRAYLPEITSFFIFSKRPGETYGFFKGEAD
ncbi:MAG: hypothetical protein PVF13_00660 [Chromatiales bacterium]|jgi:hypothetical protein